MLKVIKSADAKGHPTCSRMPMIRISIENRCRARLKVQGLGMIIRLGASIQKAAMKHIRTAAHRHREIIIFTVISLLKAVQVICIFNPGPGKVRQ